MANLVRFLAMVSALLLLNACSGTIPVTYQPQSYMEIGAGESTIGDFRYTPADEGLVKSNEIKNTAIGDVYIPTDVANLVRRATALEFERAGINITDSADYEIRGDVLFFEADDFGYSVDWNYRIKYQFTNTQAGTILINKVYRSKELKTGKFGGAASFTSAVNEIILDALEQFMSDVRELDVF